jgi:peptide/nickel transport system substrate-binding protein
MRRIIWVLAAMAAASLVLVAVGSAGTSKSEAASGSVIIGAEQEPPCLNVLLDSCNNTWQVWITQNAVRGAYMLYPDGTYKPDMLVGEAKTTNKPFSVTYKIKPNAVWNDGTQVTADDFIFTFSTIMNPKNEVASRSGYDQIQRMVKVDSKTVKAIYKAPYVNWRALFSQILPKHALQGQPDFNQVWLTSITDPRNNKPIGNGPYLVTNYTKGQSITLTANPKFYGTQAKIKTVIFRFITNTDSEIQAIRGGEVDMIYPQPQLQLAALKGVSGLAIQSNQGQTLEHIEFNVGATGMPLARAPWFRQAVAYSIDRAALVKTLYGTLNSKLAPLQNMHYTNTQSEYQPDFERYKYDVNKVASIMQKNNCTKGGDGIWSCGGVRASIKFSTTAGNKLRELAQEIIQAQAKKAGIEIVLDNSPSGTLFGTRLPGYQYQMSMFAWVGDPDPSDFVDIYGCGGESNYTKWCSNKYVTLMKQAAQTLDDKQRAALFNRADQLLAAGLPTYPLFQKPTYLVSKTKVKGLKDNATNAGFTWNIQEWSLG